MATIYGFHPEALAEYSEAASYYFSEASGKVADEFVEALEAAILAVITAPTRWRVVEQPEIRRYVLRRFPFVIYYRWEAHLTRVMVYAVMHCSREPGYWRQRID